MDKKPTPTTATSMVRHMTADHKASTGAVAGQSLAQLKAKHDKLHATAGHSHAPAQSYPAHEHIGTASPVRVRATEVSATVAIESIDPEKGAVITILRPGVSANHRNWKPEALKKAAESHVYDGSRMFLDHGDKRMPRNRSIRDLVSGVTDTFLGEDGSLKGHVNFFNPEFGVFAEKAQEHMGVSVTSEFKGRTGMRGAVQEEVDEIINSISVDWVAFPSAGGKIDSFITGSESEDDVDWDELTLDQVREHRPDLLEAVEAASESHEGKPAQKDPPKPGTVQLTEAELDAKIQASVKTAQESWDTTHRKSAEVGRQITAQINGAALPPKTKARLIASFDGATTYATESVQAAIDTAKEELKEAGAGPRFGMEAQLGISNSGTEAETPEEKKKILKDAAPAHMGLEAAFARTPGKGVKVGQE